MPQVPYRPVPEQALSLVPTPKVSVNTPDAAFGGAVAEGKILAAQGAATEAGAQKEIAQSKELIAQSLGLIAGQQGAVANAWVHLGQVTSHTGDELFKRALAMQDLINRADADNLTTQYAKQAGEKHAVFSSLEGKAAAAALPAYYKDLEETRAGLKGSSPNPMVQRLFDTESRNIMTRSMFNGAGHAATETKKYVHGELIGKRDAAFEQIYQNPKDPSAIGDGYRVLKESITQEAEMGGKGEDWTKMQLAKGASTITALRIKSVARTEPFKAQEMLEASRGAMHREDVEATEKAVQSQMIQVGSRIIEQKVNADLRADPLGKKKTEQERLEEGEKEAKKIGENIPGFIDAVRSRILTGVSQSRTMQRNADYENLNTINGVLSGEATGKRPTTVEEIRADPDANAAYERLDNTKRARVLKVLEHNAKGQYEFTEKSFKEYQELKGMAATDPLEFLKQDFMTKEFPFAKRDELLKMQRKLNTNAEADPRVQRAMKVLEPTLVAARVSKTDDKAGYYQFVGTMQDAINEFQSNNKKLPDTSQVREMGLRLLQEQATPGWINRWSTTPLYQVDVPSSLKEQIKNDPKWNGLIPTDEDIRRAYVRMQYKKLYDGKTKAQ